MGPGPSVAKLGYTLAPGMLNLPFFLLPISSSSFLIGVQSFYSVVFLLYHKVNQLYVYMYMYIPSLRSLPPSTPPAPRPR